MGLLKNIFCGNTNSPFPETGYFFDIGILRSSDLQGDLANRANKILNYLGRSGNLVMMVVEYSPGYCGNTQQECRDSAVNALATQLAKIECSESVVGLSNKSGNEGIQTMNDPTLHVETLQDAENIRMATKSKNIRFLLGSLNNNNNNNKFIAVLILK